MILLSCIIAALEVGVRSESFLFLRPRPCQALVRSTTQRLGRHTQPCFASGSLHGSMAGYDSRKWPPRVPLCGRQLAAPPAEHRPSFRTHPPCANGGSVRTPYATAARHAASGATQRPPAQVIEDLTQVMVVLRHLFRHQGQVGGHNGPFVITNITGVRFSFHTSSVPTTMQSA